MREMVLVIDKHIGPTSFDIVRDLKKLLPRGTKIGHGGSLDPFASGVLIILVGRATKLSSALLNADKVYVAKMKLGEARDSMDVTGNVIGSAAIPSLTEENIKSVFKSLEGEWDQIPPMYSAKKQNGIRLYTLARKQVEVKREAIKVQLYRLSLLSFTQDEINFEVHCSKGTYVRSLADEIGKRLGSLAHLTALRRTECGPFVIEEAVTVEHLKNNLDFQFRKGFENFAKLLSIEGVVRREPKSVIPSLPTNRNNDNSFAVNR